MFKIKQFLKQIFNILEQTQSEQSLSSVTMLQCTGQLSWYGSLGQGSKINYKKCLSLI